MRIPLEDLKRAIAEQQALVGSRVDNVYQVDARVFLLRFSPGREWLRIDGTPGRARTLVTDRPPPVPDSPPVLGQILRRALRGGRLEAVIVPREDRIVFYDVQVEGRRRRLVVEALPRHPNLLLLDASDRVERVLDGEAARHRGNPVGAIYALPEPPHFKPDPSALPAALPEGPYAANHALDGLFSAEAREQEEVREKKDLTRLLDRLRRAREAVDRDLRAVPDAAGLRAEGELLLVHFAELQQGMGKFQGVTLDPKLSPVENIERLFERARKAERAGPALRNRAEEIDDLVRRVEAGEEVPESRIPGRKGGPQPPRKPYRVFTSADGRRILVGKGGRDNDETTLRVAGPHDLFLHVRGMPGSHVIVPLRRDEEVPEQTLLDAATLALHYSKARTARSCEVTWTRRKHVSKPKGAKPGLVQVRQEKVLQLRREPDRLARLLMTAGEDDGE